MREPWQRAFPINFCEILSLAHTPRPGQRQMWDGKFSAYCVFTVTASAACSASAAALSVASQVNSGSERPKWP